MGVSSGACLLDSSVGFGWAEGGHFGVHEGRRQFEFEFERVYSMLVGCCPPPRLSCYWGLLSPAAMGSTMCYCGSSYRPACCVAQPLRRPRQAGRLIDCPPPFLCLHAGALHHRRVAPAQQQRRGQEAERPAEAGGGADGQVPGPPSSASSALTCGGGPAHP